MSILLSHIDKDRVVDQLFSLLQTVTFSRIASPDRLAITQHFEAMRVDQRTLDVTCTLATDPMTETTEVRFVCKPR